MEKMPDNLCPRVGASEAPSVRRLEATFGDGYEQRTPDGLNNVRGQWQGLEWKADHDDCGAVWNFLYPYYQSGAAFAWNPPEFFGKPQRTVKVVVESLSRTFVNGVTVASVTASFREVFDL